MAPSPKVIIFGPTGAVGSAAASTAHRLGADVTLAMRDTSKPIRGLDSSASCTKITADLTQPDTVLAAAKQSGATHAFFYFTFGAPGGMRSTIQALKDGGIEFVVFLSSFTVRGDLAAIPPQDVIDHAHAQVELQLEAVFGRANFVALRPGAFASNEHQYAAGFAAGEVKIPFPKPKIDNIVPADIGRVAGHWLAKGPPEDGTRAIYLYGPEFLTPQESVATIAKVLGKEDGKVVDCDEAEARKVLTEERHFPPLLAEYLLRQTHGPQPDVEYAVFGKEVNPDDRGNVTKYGGGERSTTFEEYVRENREKFEVVA